MKNRSCGLCAARRGLGNPRAWGQGSRHKHSPGAPRAPTTPPAPPRRSQRSTGKKAKATSHRQQAASSKQQAARPHPSPSPSPQSNHSGSKQPKPPQNLKTPISPIQSRETAHGGIGQRRIGGFRKEGLRGSRHPRGLSKRFARDRWGLKSKRFSQASIHWAICVCVSVRISRKQ